MDNLRRAFNNFAFIAANNQRYWCKSVMLRHDGKWKDFLNMTLIGLGELTIDLQAQCILQGEQEIAMEPKQFQLLLLFLEYPQQIVSRQQILDSIWPNQLVTDNAVNKLVANLRNTLNDNPKSPQYIKTVPKRGYRLVAQYQQLNSQEFANSSNDKVVDNVEYSPQKGTRYYSWNWGIVAITLLMLSFVYAFYGKNNDSPGEVSSSAQYDFALLTKLPGLERSPLLSENQDVLAFLREDIDTGYRSLWLKELSNEVSVEISGVTEFVSRLIAFYQDGEHWQLLYLAQENNDCHISQAVIDADYSLVDNIELMTCDDMHVFDVAFTRSGEQLFYSAQREHETKARIYRLDLTTRAQQLITQPEVSGKGNRGIDLSPDERKLLIVQLDKNYASQLVALDLYSNKLDFGLQSQHNLAQATWSRDSEHIMYFSAFPSRQILQSDLHGENLEVLIQMPDYIEREFISIPNSDKVLFSTINRDYNIRWLTSSLGEGEVVNSTVYDIRPTLAHHSNQFIFVSTRLGKRHLYVSEPGKTGERLLAKLKQDRAIRRLSLSPDDKVLLLTDSSRLWLAKMQELFSLKSSSKQLDLSSATATLEFDGVIMAARWLNEQSVFVKVQQQGQVLSYIYDVIQQKLLQVPSQWQDLVADHADTGSLYLISKDIGEIYKIPVQQLPDVINAKQLRFSDLDTIATGKSIAKAYSDINAHLGKLYYSTSTIKNSPTAYSYQIEVMDLAVDNNDIDILPARCQCGFDVSNSGFIVSELQAIKGDVYLAGATKYSEP